jgi:four helix bundle protein
MENQGSKNFNEQMRDRTLNMSIQVEELVSSRKIPMLSRHAVLQLVRSSSSVAANFRAATRARSYAEFFAKICIVVEECDETQYWLDYLIGTGFLALPESLILKGEVLQLVKIFTTMKKNIEKKLNGIL